VTGPASSRETRATAVARKAMSPRRVAFAFDGQRVAVLLAAGNKAGVPEMRLYKRLIAAIEETWGS
jgi:hypothetical protein